MRTRRTGLRMGAVAIGAATVMLTLHGCSHSPQYFQSRGERYFARSSTLAAMPLANLSKYAQAEEIVMNALLVELLDSGLFEIVDPGLVEEVVLEQRLRMTDRLSAETLKTIGGRLNVQYVLLGTVNEFNFMQDVRGKIPSVSVSLRIVECNSGRIVWAGTHSKRGDDAEKIFGLGRVETLEQLAALTVHELTDTLKPDGDRKP